MEKKLQEIIIVCAGSDYKKEKIISACRRKNFIIAVDGGLAVLTQFKIKPDLIIGDMDSIDENILKKNKDIQSEIYQPEKNLTDSELALIKALSFAPKTIKLFNATGNYSDHSLANLINILKYQNNKTEIEIHTANSKIFSISKKIEIDNSIDRRFSLFPLGKISGFKMTGSKYQFKNNALDLFNYGISNVIAEKKLCIKIRKGLLLCILFDEGYK